MEIKLILAMVRRDRLEPIERKLREAGVERVDVSNVKGYGEYRNFFSSDWMGEEVRIEVFPRQHKAASVVQAIIDGAHTGMPGDAVVAVLPVSTRGGDRHTIRVVRVHGDRPGVPVETRGVSGSGRSKTRPCSPPYRSPGASLGGWRFRP